MMEIAQYISGIQGARILAGDLNVTSWSPFFKDWLRESGLHDSRLGFGVQATWPTTSPLFLIPLDHVLVSPDIQVMQRQVGADVGSDHRPVLIDFTFKSGQ
jgi:endonuclease/exonuclease/phosphatase (EEP) superfamily protein YafD